MVKLRLKRLGKKHQPFYRIVAMKAKTKRDGETIEDLGHYNPMSKDTKVNTERIQYWLSVGAQPTDSVVRILVRQGVVDEKKYAKKTYKKEAGQKSKDRSEKKAEKLAESKKEKEQPKEEVVVEAKAEAAAE